VPPANTTPRRGLTVKDAAALFRVSPDKVRFWIKSGELLAINTAGVGSKARYVILPDSLERFGRGRAAADPPPPPRRRRRARVDHFADL
jgi:hypothetical protein